MEPFRMLFLFLISERVFALEVSRTQRLSLKLTNTDKLELFSFLRN